MKEQLIIKMGGNRELNMAINAALRSIGFEDQTPANLAEKDLLIRRGDRQIHASNIGENWPPAINTTIDATAESLYRILDDAKRFLPEPTIKLPFQLGKYNVIVTPGQKVKVGCVEVTTDQLRAINEAFSSSQT